jgi:hypothetical protein
MKAWSLFVVGALLFGCGRTGSGPNSAESQASEIPIRRVVLYQNGVGYFEREGRVQGNVLALRIRPSQINDLLKSLTVIDAGSGRAVSISLPLEKSGDRVLSELPDQVRNASGLLDVLSVFRGATIEIEGRAGNPTGRVVGVENLMTREGDDVVPDWRVTLRTDAGELVVYPVNQIHSIVIQDRALSVGLDESLDVSLNQGDWKPITLSIRLAGEDEHQLRASYIVEMPRWKPAYRIVLGSDKPLLQGWAVVDNVSGEHWRNVDLSLVAGAPLSFIYDLHSSQYTDRVDMSPKGRQLAAAPPVESGGVEGDADDTSEMAYDEAPAEEAAADIDLEKAASGGARRSAATSKPMPARMTAPPPAPGGGIGSSAKTSALDEQLEQQNAPTVTAQEMGALFRYDIADPVTVPDRSSTLVSIINQRVSAQEVAFFRPEREGEPLATHPYRAIKFTNDTPFTLEKGPVTLYADRTFVGEGFLDRVEPGSTHFVSYAIDGKVSLRSDYDTEEEGAKLLRISNGLIESEILRIERTTYTIKNLRREPITAYVKTERRAGWELRNTPEGTVEKPEALLVPVTVKGGKSAKLPIEWTSKVVKNLGVDTSLGVNVLKLYLKGGNVPADTSAALQQVLSVKARLDQNRAESQRLRKQHSETSHDQDRVRANLNTLRKTTGNQALQVELAKKLAQQEQDLGKLSGRLVELSEAEAVLGRELGELLKNVTLSAGVQKP